MTYTVYIMSISDTYTAYLILLLLSKPLNAQHITSINLSQKPEESTQRRFGSIKKGKHTRQIKRAGTNLLFKKLQSRDSVLLFTKRTRLHNNLSNDRLF